MVGKREDGDTGARRGLQLLREGRQFGRGIGSKKGGDVGPLGYVNVNGVAPSFRLVIFPQSQAQAAGLDAHYGIDAGIEAVLAIEGLSPDDVLLELVRAAVE